MKNSVPIHVEEVFLLKCSESDHKTIQVEGGHKQCFCMIS